MLGVEILNCWDSESQELFLPMQGVTLGVRLYQAWWKLTRPYENQLGLFIPELKQN